MDQIKIGKFIAERRKQGGLTQMQLAELLGITDRAVSKWETGAAVPELDKLVKLSKYAHVDGVAAILDALCMRQNKWAELGGRLMNAG